jgi:DNA polymerase-4
MLESLQQRLKTVLGQVQQKQLLARTLTIKVKFSDFTQVTRSHSFDLASRDYVQFECYLLPLLQSTQAGLKPVRLLGVTLSSFEREQPVGAVKQLDLF